MYLAAYVTPRSFEWLYGRQPVCISPATTDLRGCLETAADARCRRQRQALMVADHKTYPCERLHKFYCNRCVCIRNVLL